MFCGDYPRKPLTDEQKRENRKFDQRMGRIERLYELRKERLRADLSKKYGIEWEGQLEGDWEAVGRCSPPHVAEYDFDKFTESQKAWFQSEQAMVRKMVEQDGGALLSNWAKLSE